MTYLTRQEAFDKAYKGLAGQGFKKSILSNGLESCAYRGADGLKCAVGFLIPDEKYQKKFEGVAVCEPYELVSERREILEELFEAANIDPEDALFYEGLQYAHDNSEVIDMETNLRNLAKMYHLTIPEV